MKIILTNGLELNPIMVTGETRHIQGADRDTLSFVFPETVSLDELDAVFTAENCESIKLFETQIVTDEEDNEVPVEVEHIHTGYTIRAELIRKPVAMNRETENEPVVYENRVFVSMSQRTYAENQLASLTDTVDVLVMESLMQ